MDAIGLAALVFVPLWFDAGPSVAGVDAALTAKRLAVELVACLGVAVALAGSIATGRARWAPRATDVALLLFLVWFAASRTWAASPASTDAELLALVSAAAIGTFVRSAAATPSGALRAIDALVAGGAIAALVDAVAASRFEGARDRLIVAGGEKFASLLFGHQNTAAACFAPLAITALVVAVRTCGGRRLGHAFASIVLGAATVASGSKLAILAMIVGVPGTWLAARISARVDRTMQHRRGRAAIEIAILAVAGGLAVFIPTRPTASRVLKDVFNHVLYWIGVDHRSGNLRPSLWKNAFRMFSEHPVVGVGGGNFQTSLAAFDAQWELKSHAHDQLLQVLAELGGVGLALFCAYLAFVFASDARVAAQAVRGTGDAPRPMLDAASAAGAGLVTALVLAAFETPLAFPATAVGLFALIGVVQACDRPVVETRVPRALRFGLAPLVLVALAVFVPQRMLAAPRRLQFLRAAEAERSEGDLHAAVSFARRAVEVEGGVATAHRALGRLELESGDLPAALHAFERATETLPGDPALWEARADLQIRLQRFDDAFALLDRARRRFPLVREFDALTGRALLESGRLDEAIVTLERMRALGAESDAAVLTLANSYYARCVRDRSLADADAARRCYERYAAHGASGSTGWVSQRIDQVSDWIRRQQVDVRAASQPTPPR